jgi:hypothetical protein
MEGPAPERRLVGGALELLPACCRVRTDAGVLDLTAEAWRAVGDDLRARAGPVEMRLRTRRRRGFEELTLSASCGEPVVVDAIGVRLRALPDGEPAWALQEGYQSWDAAGIVPFSQARQSWWRFAVAGPSGGGVALAAGSARRHGTRFDVAGDEVRWLQVAPTLGMGERPVWCSGRSRTFTSEPLRVAAGADVRAAARRCLVHLARRSGAAPRGWLSWYHLGIWVDAQGVEANSELLQLSPAVVQMDDGWQLTYGDWFPNTKFPDLAGLCRELAIRGQIPGVWTAPFLASGSSDLAAAAPESWFLHDPASGERLVDPRHTVFGPMYVLDASQSAVRRHLTQTFRRLRGYGFRHFKIDFLYAGAYAGLDALRRGLRAIRRGAGADAYLLASGAPLLPVAGLADGCRIGPDTCTPWLNLATGEPQPTFFGDEVLNVIRNVGARGDLGPWFQTDPDVAVAGGTLSAARARQLITAVALCGGLYFLSDDLRVLAPARRALIANQEVAGLVGGGPATPDWEPNDRDLPASRWRRADGVVAVFNHGAAPLAAAVAVPPGGSARDLWSGRRLRPPAGRLDLEVEPEGVRLLRLEA